MKMLTPTVAGYKTSIHPSGMCLCSFDKMHVVCTTHSTGLNATKHPFFSHKSSLINYLVHSMKKHVFRSRESFSFLKLVGLGATADPKGSNSRWQKLAYTHSIVISSKCTHVQFRYNFLFQSFVPVCGNVKLM